MLIYFVKVILSQQRNGSGVIAINIFMGILSPKFKKEFIMPVPPKNKRQFEKDRLDRAIDEFAALK